MKKFAIQLLLIFAFVLAFSPAVFAQYEEYEGLSDQYLDCLCKCACNEAGWICGVVVCSYCPDDLTGSPSCSDASKGPCKCEGFGCGRAQIDMSSECALNCKARYEGKASCDSLRSQYETTRVNYVNFSNSLQELNKKEMEAVLIYNSNLAKMTIGFVVENLSSPPASAQDITKEILKKVVEKAGFPEKQSNLTKAEIQASILRYLRGIRIEISVLKNQTSTAMGDLRGLNTDIDNEHCTQVESLESLPSEPVTPNILSDVNPEDPRGMIIDSLQKQGVIGGYDDGTYKPEKSINRAEFLKILIESKYPGQASGSYCFDDVKDEWYSPYVCTAKNKGIVSGYPDGSFQPARTINAVEALKITLETIRPADIKVSADEKEWWEKYWNSAVALDVLADDVVNPSQEINRGQMAEIVFMTMGVDYLDYSAVEEEQTSLGGVVPDTTVADPGHATFSNLFKDEYLGFGLYYPDDWMAFKNNDDSMVALGPIHDNGRPAVSIEKYASSMIGGMYNNAFTVINEYVEQVESMYNSTVSEVVTVQIDLPGYAGVTASVFDAVYEFDGVMFGQLQMVFADPSNNGQYIYAVAYSAPLDIYEEYFDVGGAIIDSWYLL